MVDLFGNEVDESIGNVHFSTGNDEWYTPPDVFDDLDNEFGFTLDPCSDGDNAKCEKYYTSIDNGLIQDWSNDTVFMNPPYSEIDKWIAKAYHESQKGATVVCLIPSRTDTRWWHKFVMRADDIRFIKGRLKFGGSENNAPFPSAIIVFKNTEKNDRT